MDISEAILDSWDRQCLILESVTSLIDESNRHAKPSEDGWPLDKQLAHIHNTRRSFLSQVAPSCAAGLGASYADEVGTPIADLTMIKDNLVESGAAIKKAVSDGLANGNASMVGEYVTYDNPVCLLQHMIWHEGWHVGLIFLALRLSGQEPSEEWEEANVWGHWRTESW